MNKLMRVTDLDYIERGQEVIVRLVGRDEFGKRSIHRVEGTRPCLWVREEVDIPNKVFEAYVDEIEFGYESFDGIELKRVITHLPNHVRKVRDNLEETWEADIPYVRRVSVDWDLTGYIEVPDKENLHIDEIDSVDAEDVENIEPRVFIADIETLPPTGSDQGFEKYTEKAPEPVLMITVYDTYDEEYTVLVRDPDGKVNGGKVREHLDDHWHGHDDGDTYANCEINLRVATTEEDLLNSFVDLTVEKRPDLFSGWNWVKFDHRYLLNRMEKFDGVDETRMSDFGEIGGRVYERLISGLPGFDMMQAYCDQMTFHDWRSRALDYVSNEVLGVGKVEDISIGDNYENDRSKLLAYNIIDVQLTVALDDVFGIHEFFYLLAELSGVQIYDTFSAMRLVDGFILSRRDDNEILPSTEEKNLDANAGGLVLSPSDRISEWVGVFDLKSLYPSAFITTNCSTETITKDPEEADIIVPWMPEKEKDVPGQTIDASDIEWDIDKGIGVSLDKEGIIPKYVRMLFETRNSMKATRNTFDPDSEDYSVWDARQNAVKVVMNSFYGVSSNDYWRLSTPELGDTVTAAARYVTWTGTNIAKDLDYKVRYGDTDSIMLELAAADGGKTPHEVVADGEELEQIINDRTSQVADDFGIGEQHPYLAGGNLHGTDRHCFTWEFEKLYRRFFQAGSKKRYSGLIFWKEGKWLVDPENAKAEDADLDVTGYEAKRSDVPEITAEVQTEIMTRVLNGESFEDVSEYLKHIVDIIENDKIPLRRIGKPGAINKPLHEYPNRETPRACKYMNQNLGYNWGEGDDPWVYYVDTTPPMAPGTDVMALEWSEQAPDGFVLDKTKHINKYVRDPIESVVEKAGWTFEELKSGKRSQAIEFGAGGGGGSVFGSPSKENKSESSNPFTSGDSDEEEEEDEDDNLFESSGNPFSGNDSNDEAEEQDEEHGALDW
jgi:DNA polymerase elongation subunit (family B)